MVVNGAVLETRDIAKDLHTSAQGEFFAYFPPNKKSKQSLILLLLLSGEFWRFLPNGDHLVKAVSADKSLQSTEFDVKVTSCLFITLLSSKHINAKV